MGSQPGICLGQGGVATAQHVDPDLDILPLLAAHLPFGRRRQVSQVAVLNADQVRLGQREVQMEVDQGLQGGFGIIGSLGHLVRPGEQSGADSDEQLHQQCFLVGKVSVDRRPAYPGCRADVLQPHSEIAVPSHQPFRGSDQLVASIGLGAAAAGGHLGRR